MKIEDPKFGWMVLTDPSLGAVHVVPTFDTNPHYFEHCTCNPKIDEDGIVVHNSFDGREQFETNERLKS